MNAKTVFILIATALLFNACSKDDPAPEPTPVNKGSVSVNINYKVDGTPLLFDTIKYVNEAGNHYSIENLAYYISNITLHKSDGSSCATGNAQFVDARKPATNLFTLNEIPEGSYTSVSFNIGVEPLRNCENGLPATTDNLNMIWPQPMGGGYHFLKMEGYFSDTSGTPGFAMHLGTNDCLVTVTIPEVFSITTGNHSMQLTMNINEWFKNPEVYDFNTDGNYSMGNMMAMMKLTHNGGDVFNK